MRTTHFFLHGLESSSRGTKGRWFGDHFPDMIIPDFTGDLSSRLHLLETLCRNKTNLVLVGSSFGGLMATMFAIGHEELCSRLILLAPALNFTEFSLPENKIAIPTRLIIGKHDTVTPPEEVVPLANQTFLNLDVMICDDDHLLHTVFDKIDWQDMLQKDNR